MRETLVKTEEFKDSPVGKIPKDWETTTLDKIIRIIDCKHYTPKYTSTGSPIVRPRNIKIEGLDFSDVDYVSANEYRLLTDKHTPRLGDIVFSRNASFGVPCYVDITQPFAIGQDVVIMTELTANTRFIYYTLISDSIKKQIQNVSAGSTFERINLAAIRNLIVPVPPIEEQELIAEILDTLDDAIAHTSSLIAKLKQMKAGLLHDLLTRGLDENGELRDAIAHPEQFKDSLLGQIPKDWDVRLVGEVFDLQLGKMLSKASKIGHSPFPYLANRNVQWDEVDLSDLEWMDFNDNEREKFSLLPGDLLVCEGGESGRTAIWKGEMENCYFQKAIHRLRPKDSQVLPDYMLRFMRRAFEHGFLTSFTSQTSITHLTREKFALLPLPLPKVEEQKAIVNVLDSLDTRIHKEEAYREKLKLQKQGLMHDLLTGKVRVKNA